MASVVTMPRLGLTMQEGTVAKWCVEIGEQVSEGDDLFEVATDKLTNTVQAEEDGILLAVLVKEGEKVACQTPLCVIGVAGEDISEYI